MLESLLGIVIVVGAGLLWFAGLQLFLQSELSRTRKVAWTTILVLVGTGIGIVFPLGQVWRKFLLLIVVLPVLGLADVLLLRSGRGLSFWIRACGFEICTVFAAAAVARFSLDLVDLTALLPQVK